MPKGYNNPRIVSEMTSIIGREVENVAARTNAIEREARVIVGDGSFAKDIEILLVEIRGSAELIDTARSERRGAIARMKEESDRVANLGRAFLRPAIAV